MFRELIRFIYLESKSCIFAGTFFLLLFVSHYIHIGIPRYDFIFLGALCIQVVLIFTKIETFDELKVISMFHIIGLIFELFKTSPQIGAWSYPEISFFRIGTVPLYSGFMYAAVASYMIQAWRNLKLKLTHYPPTWITVILGVFIYLNFFTKHFFPDMRFVFIGATFIIFFRTKVTFTTVKRHTMPLVVAFFLIGFFIWIAENISTYFGAWKYPDQLESWHIVSFAKITSWFLYCIISFIIVAHLKHLKEHIQKNV